MKFCSECGSPVRQGIPEGDDHVRHICDSCGSIHYHNPKLIAGCIPVWGDRILLCKRAIDPRKGFWTLPAGFMEQGETLSQAARREALEEANINVEIDDVYTLFSLPQISQVHVFFRARMIDEHFFPGLESLETRLFREDEIPWEDIAFEAVRRSLEHFLLDRKSGEFLLRLEDLSPERWRTLG